MGAKEKQRQGITIPTKNHTGSIIPDTPSWDSSLGQGYASSIGTNSDFLYNSETDMSGSLAFASQPTSPRNTDETTTTKPMVLATKEPEDKRTLLSLLLCCCFRNKKHISYEQIK